MFLIYVNFIGREFKFAPKNEINSLRKKNKMKKMPKNPQKMQNKNKISKLARLHNFQLTTIIMLAFANAVELSKFFFLLSNTFCIFRMLPQLLHRLGEAALFHAMNLGWPQICRQFVE